MSHGRRISTLRASAIDSSGVLVPPAVANVPDAGSHVRWLPDPEPTRPCCPLMSNAVIESLYVAMDAKGFVRLTAT